MALSKTQQTALQDLSSGIAIHESWASYIELTGVSKGVNIRSLFALVRSGFASVRTNRSTTTNPAGPFGTTSRGWVRHQYTQHVFTITDDGRAHLAEGSDNAH